MAASVSWNLRLHTPEGAAVVTLEKILAQTPQYLRTPRWYRLNLCARQLVVADKQVAEAHGLVTQL